MPFMVIYTTSDGETCHELADAIDEAALFIERLRNKEGIDQIRIYRMEEISFAFRPYYKVELGMPDRGSSTPPPEVVGNGTASPAAESLPRREAREPEVVDAAPADVPPLSKRGDHEVTLPPPAAESAVPPPPGAEDVTAGANGRRGLFGR